MITVKQRLHPALRDVINRFAARTGENVIVINTPVGGDAVAPELTDPPPLKNEEEDKE
jgi:hypothetical protein